MIIAITTPCKVTAGPYNYNFKKHKLRERCNSDCYFDFNGMEVLVFIDLLTDTNYLKDYMIDLYNPIHCMEGG